MDLDKKYIITFSVIIMIVLAFAYLDAGVKSSNINANSATSTYSFGETESFSSNDVLLYVHEGNSFDSILEKKLLGSFEDNGYSVTLTDRVKEDHGSRFVFVNVTGMDMVYTPVYSRSDVDVFFGFSSSGRTKYLDINGTDDRKTVVFSSEDVDGYQLLARGNMDIQDVTKGIFTYRSYRNYIAGEIASSVTKELTTQIKKVN